MVLLVPLQLERHLHLQLEQHRLLQLEQLRLLRLEQPLLPPWPLPLLQLELVHLLPELLARPVEHNSAHVHLRLNMKLAATEPGASPNPANRDWSALNLEATSIASKDKLPLPRPQLPLELPLHLQLLQLEALLLPDNPVLPVEVKSVPPLRLMRLAPTESGVDIRAVLRDRPVIPRARTSIAIKWHHIVLAT